MAIITLAHKRMVLTKQKSCIQQIRSSSFGKNPERAPMSTSSQYESFISKFRSMHMDKDKGTSTPIYPDSTFAGIPCASHTISESDLRSLKE